MSLEKEHNNNNNNNQIKEDNKNNIKNDISEDINVNKDLNLKQLQDLIIDVPDYPKPGIIYKDISPLFLDPTAYQSIINYFAPTIPPETDKILAIESRGFILAAGISQKIEKGFALVRKAGKLPRPVHSVEYELEYGTDKLEIHQDAIQKGERVIIIDDVLATGGTVKAVQQLCSLLGAEILGQRFLLELSFLKGRNKLEFDTKSLFVI